ncbi:MAG: AI-2E family transporter, partial [Betaproteobacteria bacterium]|nr:AI-2E family transporter [Betaproteobacteria bacterium]
MEQGRKQLGSGTVPGQPAGSARFATKVMLSGGWFYGALIVALSVWILHSFLDALLVACVTAIASWPLYRQFAARLPRRMPRSATALIFTCVMTIFVLAPLMFGFGALLTEAHSLLLEIAAADKTGIAVPHGLENLPLVGPWVAARWQSELAHPEALLLWVQRMDATALLAWAQPLGHFMIRHLFIVTFTILVLFYLYQEGESLADGFSRLLGRRIGERAEAYVDLGVRALRASVSSMLVVGLFDGFASWAAFAVAGVPHAALWAVITGSLALVPFLGYVAVAALALKLTMAGAATPALLSFGLGCAVLFCGDKIVRPVIARDATRLRFVWILMGCLGGFEVLGLVGLVVGPVLLTITRELWEQRVRELVPPAVTNPTSPVD